MLPTKCEIGDVNCDTCAQDNTLMSKLQSPFGRRWREAPDEGRHAETFQHACPLPIRLEAQPDLSLEFPVRIGFCRSAGNQPEIRIVDIQVGIGRIRMVQNVGGIHTDLQVLRFGQLDALRHACIKTPPARAFHGALAEDAACTGQWILKKDLAGFHIGDCAQSAQVPKILNRSHTGALWIEDLFIVVFGEIASAWTARELNEARLYIERTDDIRRPVGVKHILGDNVERRTGVRIEDLTHLPTFDSPRQHACAVASQQLAWAER